MSSLWKGRGERGQHLEFLQTFSYELALAASALSLPATTLVSLLVNSHGVLRNKPLWVPFLFAVVLKPKSGCSLLPLLSLQRDTHPGCSHWSWQLEDKGWWPKDTPCSFGGQERWWLASSAASMGGTTDISRMRRSAAFIGVLWILVITSRCQWAVAHSVNCELLRIKASRPHRVTITEFGAVGDGKTLNTKAFQNAIFYLRSFADKGGAQLFVPAGSWLTGSFTLISHLTLSLDNDAVIIGSTDPTNWPVIDALPSYGRGRELPGGRHQSLIHGYNLTDVVITGENGTIEGQGSIWWDLFKNKTLDYTRPHLVELMYSTGVVITNLTFKNSPFWAIHPVYSSQVLIQNVTILAPLDSPNTDGIDPDSSSNVCIEDCYISTGDDLIVIKSGWDQYGISFARPSSNISIRRIMGKAGSGAGIAFGSEMSGGISEVEAEGIQLSNSLHGIRIKTAPGRGGYIRNIFISDMVMTDVHYAIRITGQYGEHPDDNYDPNALPVIDRITISNLTGVNISVAGLLEGIQGSNFSNICLSNLFLNVTSDAPWNCSNIQGYSNMVTPESCEPLREVPDSSVCYKSNHLSGQLSNVNYLVSPFVKFAPL